MKRLSQHAWFLLPTGGVWLQMVPRNLEGAAAVWFWLLFSVALSMGMSLAVLSSC